MIIEVKPGEGGEDAEAFANDLIFSISKWSATNMAKITMFNQRTMKVEARKECL